MSLLGRQRNSFAICTTPPSSRWVATVAPRDDVHNFHRILVFKHPINQDERQRRQGQLASTLHSATPPTLWERLDHCETLINLLAHLPRSGGILQPDVINDTFEVGRRIG